MKYRDELIVRFWRYAEEKGFLEKLDSAEPGIRPPVFTFQNSSLNVIRADGDPDARLAELIGTIQPKHRHRWFRSMTSSQALAQSVFGNLIVHKKLDVLGDIHTETGEPLVGRNPKSAKLECGINYLGEKAPRITSLDVHVECEDGYHVAVECKLTEAKVGDCSRPNLKEDDPKYKEEFCNGSYKCQLGRTVPCSLTSIGVEYWKHIPKIFFWDAEAVYENCPVRYTYQLVRNILAVSVDNCGEFNPGKGHAVLIYDARNPKFSSGGDGCNSYQQTSDALRNKSLLRRCSWQTIMEHLRQVGSLKWLTDELAMKYGL